MRTLFSVTLFLLSLAVSSDSNAEDRVDYLKQIKPLLTTKCYSCHGVLKQEATLRLETRDLMHKGGDSGAVIVPGKPAESLIIERITADEDSRMPPAEEGAALKPKEIELIRNWIAQGAVAPEEEIPVGPRDHWAFQRIEKPAVPKIRSESGLIEHPIDAFLEQKRVQKTLRTQPEAERSILIRRLYLDLIGLPPSIEQLRDERPWNEIVDELLASPQHGERWGRHWMDVWRYTDWYGLGAQLRNSQKHIWRWRDWIIESLNADKGYDQMIHEMLAGDEIAPNDPDVVRATGFLARNYYLFNRTTWLDSTIEHTGKAFLGLTLNCAKCHDHKYDPVTQLDYYRFRAIFEPHQVRLDPIPGVTNFERDGLPRVFDDHLDAPTYLDRRGDPKNPDKEHPLSPGVPDFLAEFAPEIEPVALPPAAYAPGIRDYVQQDHLNAAEAKVQAATKELASAQEKLKLAEKTAEKPKPEVAESKPFKLQEDFDKPNPELWEVIGKGWKFQDGALHQTIATRDKELVRLREPHPRDFQLTCKYTTTGGTTYKSVTFRFDHSEDQSYDNFVYTSAYEAGPKVQIAYTRDGKNTYPSQGQVGKPIKVGETYELKFAVREMLVNVWLNEEFLLAYRLPDRRPGGRLSLSGFDATVAFDDLTLESLPADVKLQEVKSSGEKAPDPETAVKLAESKLKLEQAKLEHLRAVIAADSLRYSQESDQDALSSLTRQAATLEAESMKADAEYQLAAASGDANKTKAAEAVLAKANQKLAAIEKGDIEYTSLRASLKALETPAHTDATYPATYPETSTGRRLALAKWMTSRENPLTARVIVNQVWMRHFGQPLVESVFDFGLRSKRPEHADLLDFLSADFIESGWSFRHLHRLIVTSQAYRLSSSTYAADEATLANDSTNQYYWRMNARRMESELVRDCLLQLGGELDLTQGGPSVDPGKGSKRRSLYFKHSRDDKDQFLSMFDHADLLQCYRRTESIVPQQALALANSELSLTMADKIAARFSNSARDRFIDRAFEALLGRLPDDEERGASLEFFSELEQLSGEGTASMSESRIRARFIHALLNHNDFISIR